MITIKTINIYIYISLNVVKEKAATCNLVFILFQFCQLYLEKRSQHQSNDNLPQKEMTEMLLYKAKC